VNDLPSFLFLFSFFARHFALMQTLGDSLLFALFSPSSWPSLKGRNFDIGAGTHKMGEKPKKIK
jgi:hypothetical protein